MTAIENRSAPGTVQLIDAKGELHVKHSKAAQDVVLVPLPSGMSPMYVHCLEKIS
jgi:hypothetical protein